MGIDEDSLRRPRSGTAGASETPTPPRAPHRRESLRYLDTQLRSSPPEYVFGILNEELTRLLIQLQSSSPSEDAPPREDLIEKITLILDELVRAVESRPGSPFKELSDLYRSFQKILSVAPNDLTRSLPEMTQLLVTLMKRLGEESRNEPEKK